MNIPVTFFRDQFAVRKAEQSVALGELAHWIETTTAASKTSLPWLKLAWFGELRSDHYSLRWDGNMLAITGIEADYDAEQISFDQAVETAGAAGILCIIYTSPSHTEPAPRWRVLCPLSRLHLPERRDRFLNRLNGLFWGVFARESWTRSQSYYYGSVNRNPAHRVAVLDGTPIDQMPELDAIAIGRPQREVEKPEAATHQRPLAASVPPDLSRITAARLAGKVRSLLANISNARKPNVHNTLLRIARTVGGYAWLLPYSDDELLGMLLNALPPDDHPDPKTERQTALDGLTHGKLSPLYLEERPYPRSSRAQFAGRPSE